MRNRGIVQQCQRIGNRNTVITAQRGSLGENMAAIMGNVQSIHSHIKRAGSILLTDHIDMALQDHRLMVLIAAGTLLENNHIVYFVLNIAQSTRFRKIDQIIADSLGIAGAMGNGANLFEISKHRSRLQACEFNSIHLKHSLYPNSGVSISQT